MFFASFYGKKRSMTCPSDLAPLPPVISTKRSAWRDLSTMLEMTKRGAWDDKEKGHSILSSNALFLCSEK